MKAGVAAGIAVLRAHAADPDRVGNILLLATSDEEDRSVGMRAAAAALPALLAEWGLDARLGINLDATIDNGDGATGRVVAFGCVGKHLLSALVVGREVHACYPWRGVNASHLAATLICAIEGTPELTEGAGFERAAPPTVLASADTKTVYNVTTPGRAWTVWNVLTQRRTAEEVMAIARRLAVEAIVEARETAFVRCAALDDAPTPTTAWNHVEVLDYADLYRAAAAADPAFEARFAARAGALARDNTLDLPTRARILTELAWDASGREGPAVVLGFASLPYPATTFPDPAFQARLTAVAHATAARLGTTVAIADYLPVIVDMPFLGHIDAADLRHAAAHSPLWGTSINWDLERPTPKVPMINVGPWGRDYHHWLERGSRRLRVHRAARTGARPRRGRARGELNRHRTSSRHFAAITRARSGPDPACRTSAGSSPDSRRTRCTSIRTCRGSVGTRDRPSARPATRRRPCSCRAG